VIVVLLLEELQTLLLLDLLVLGLLAGAAHRVVVLGALRTILRVDALRLGLDPILAGLAGRAGLTECETVARVV
jgi:hypothetical protein